MRTVNTVDVRCIECDGPVRRAGRYILCEDHACRTKFRPQEARFPCPEDGCGERAIVVPGLMTGEWVRKPGTRKGRVLKGDMFLLCPKLHRTRVERPDEMSPATSPRRRTRGFYR